MTNPEITGWLRKFAIKPCHKTPMANRISPDSVASTRAALTYSGDPVATTHPYAEAVISDATATGPKASVALVPNKT